MALLLRHCSPYTFYFAIQCYCLRCCLLTSEVISRTCWVSSQTAFAWWVAERSRYIRAYHTFLFRSWENEAYTCAGRVSLLSETTLDVSEREFGGRTRRRNNGSPMLLFEQILLRLGKVTKTWIEWVVFVSFQAKRTDGSNEAGIIPSQICEERLVKGDTPAQCIFIRWLDPVICRHTVNPLLSPPPGGGLICFKPIEGGGSLNFSKLQLIRAKIVLNCVTSFLINVFSSYGILGEGHLWKRSGHAAGFVSNFQLLYTLAQFNELLLGYV